MNRESFHKWGYSGLFKWCKRTQGQEREKGLWVRLVRFFRKAFEKCSLRASMTEERRVMRKAKRQVRSHKKGFVLKRAENEILIDK